MRLDLGLLKGPLFVDYTGVTSSHLLSDTTFLNCEGNALGKMPMGGAVRCRAVLCVRADPSSLPLAGAGYAHSPTLWRLDPGKGHVTRTWRLSGC